MMKTKKTLLRPLVIFTLILTAAFSASAAEERVITPPEAIDLALKYNLEYSLFLWEQDLAAKREAAQKLPTVAISAAPAKLENGQLQKPSATLTFQLPLTARSDLRGGLTLSITQTGGQAAPIGSLNVSCDLFALKEVDRGALDLDAAEQRRAQENALVLQTIDLLIRLRSALDQHSIERQQYDLLLLTLAAAQATPGCDELPLKRQMREQAAELSRRHAEIEQLQLDLAAFLGDRAGTTYSPSVSFGKLDWVFTEDELSEEWFAASTALRKAEAELEMARARLEHEQRTRGWQVKAAGNLDHNLKWDVGVSASKTLYPREIVLEELEIALARAEHGAIVQRGKAAADLRTALSRLEAARANLELLIEQRAEVQGEWELRQRQFAAGLVTQLQLEQARLALLQAEYALDHGRCDLVLRLLELWAGCGRDLFAAVLDLID